MKIYLASQFGKRFELRELIKRMANSGLDYKIVSDWIWEEHDTSSPEYMAICARRDWNDIKRCDVFVLIESTRTELTHTLQTGGRHVETGIALQARKPVLIWEQVGPLNLYHHLGDPNVKYVNTEEELLTWLKSYAPEYP